MTLFNHQFPAPRAAALVASSIGSFALGFIIVDAEQAKDLLIASGYWIVLATLVVFAIAFARTRGAQLIGRLQRRDEQIALLLCFLAAAFLYTREAASYKVVMDEPNLAATALSMHTSRSPVIAEPSLANVGQATELDKRPFFFPLLVSLAHDATGFRPGNPFYLNFALTGILLYAFYSFARRISGSWKAAALATGLLCSSPLMAQNASGGGFEILNCLMILATARLACDFWANPTRANLGAMLACSALLAQTRYESALFVGAVGIVAALRCSRARAWPIGWTAVAFPALLLPIPWQNSFIRSHPDFWELGDELEGPFGFQFLADNLKGALRYFFAPAENLASNPAFSILAALALAFALFAIALRGAATRKALGDGFWPILAMFAFAIGNFALLMCYFWGKLDDPVASRLALPLIMASALCFAPFAKWVSTRFKSVAWLPTASIAAALFFGQVYTSARDDRGNAILQERFGWARAQLDGSLGPRTLIISASNRLWTPLRIPAISVERAVMGVERLHLHLALGTYDAIYIIQSAHVARNAAYTERHVLNPGADLGPAFKLERLATSSFYPYNFTCLSKLASIDMGEVAKAGGWDAYVAAYARSDVKEFIPAGKAAISDWERSLP